MAKKQATMLKKKASDKVKGGKAEKKIKGGGFSRRKGHGFERDVAQIFRELGFNDARRKLEYQAEAVDGTDLEQVGPFRVQCKAFQKYPNLSAIDEIKSKTGYRLLFAKGNNKPVLVAMDLDTFKKLFRGWSKNLSIKERVEEQMTFEWCSDSEQTEDNYDMGF